MSREGIQNGGPILAAAEHWKREALLHDGSVFGAGELWTLEGFKGLETHFVLNLDEGEGTFMSKLEAQLRKAPPSVKMLAAELTWVMLLCPSNTLPPKKRELVSDIWNWSGNPLPTSAQPWLADEVLDGLGSAGPGYNNHRWRELVFAIRFGLAFKALSLFERKKLLTDPWPFAQWLQNLPEGQVRQLRHMLVYLLFPDTFERIFGGGDRRLILQNLSGLSLPQVRNLSSLQIDQQLADIRRQQQDLHPGVPLDFYAEPLRSKWQAAGFDEFTSEIEEADVRAALKEIDERGVPASAESTVYDLVEGSRRYPPKVVLSLAAKHASGKEFDRSLFSGGVDSRAFKLLRSLGFVIERKDVIPELLTKFLAQASAGDSLVTRGYTSAYRGLRVKVSFGKGTPAPVPWIAFLAGDQEVQRGIYPAVLFFKSQGILLLVKCVSDAEEPAFRWPAADDASVEQYFQKTFGRHAARYGESIVVRAYGVPLDVPEQELNADIDALIAQYLELVAPTTQAHDQPAFPTTSPPTVQEPDAPPYTVKEATEALFMTQEQFEDILAIWRKKKNLVVQGPPGVGKTFFHRELAYALMETKAPQRVTTVQFHPSYAYEDFVQGYRPGESGFRLVNGLFLRFCEKARKDAGNRYVFVIDEINRGNLAKIFGELLSLLESDKRSQEWAVPLAYQQQDAKAFFVPDNVFVLGLMNTADRSLAVVDYALRRRFAFVTLSPAFSTNRFKEYLHEKGLSDELVQRIVLRMAAVNKEIAEDKVNLGLGFCIGHSFFCTPPEEVENHVDWYRQVIQSEVAPLLGEYYFDDPDKAQRLVDQLLAP